MKKPLIIVGSIAAILLPAIFLTLKVMNTATIDCEVCMEFHGKAKCRSASGPDQKSCQTTATDNACAFLASGMTDSIACSQTTPTKVSFGGGT